MKSKNIAKMPLSPLQINRKDNAERERLTGFADANSREDEAGRRAGTSVIISLGPPICQLANN